MQGERHVNEQWRLARIGGMQVEIDGLAEGRLAQRQSLTAVDARGELDIESGATGAGDATSSL